MKLTLKRDVPKQVTYNSINKNLCKELKHFIEDLFKKTG